MIRTATGKDNERLEWDFWEVSDYLGHIGDNRDRRPGDRRMGPYQCRRHPICRRAPEGDAPAAARPAARLRHAGPLRSRRAGRRLCLAGSRSSARRESGRSAQRTDRNIRVSRSGKPNHDAGLVTQFFARTGRREAGRLPAHLALSPAASTGGCTAIGSTDALAVAHYLKENLDRLTEAHAPLPRDVFRQHPAPLAPGPPPDADQHVGDEHGAVAAKRPVLGLGGGRLLRRHVHARLELRPGNGPPLPGVGAQCPRDAGPGRRIRSARRAASASAAKTPRSPTRPTASAAPCSSAIANT